jgi:hypothetical protein
VSEFDYEMNSIEGQGEMPEPTSTPLSQRATNGMRPPAYWDRARGAMESRGGGGALAFALLKVQGKVKPLMEADANNPFTKRKYATLGMYLSVIRPVLQENDILIRQGTGKIVAYGQGQKEYFLPVWMDVYHVPSGDHDRVMIEVPLSKSDAQAVGIATTYGRRYLMQSYFCVASMDDDAASAVQKRLDKDEEAGVIAGITEKIKECRTVADLEKWAKANQDGIQHLSEEALTKCRSAYSDRLREIRDASPEPETGRKVK